jgi:hypothetical protein
MQLRDRNKLTLDDRIEHPSKYQRIRDAALQLIE